MVFFFQKRNVEKRLKTLTVNYYIKLIIPNGVFREGRHIAPGNAFLRGANFKYR